jgi:hypothetical protein
VFWLWGFPPVGIWMLYRDTTMSRFLKIRIMVYAIAIPVLLSIVWMIFEFDQAEKIIRASGGGF